VHLAGFPEAAGREAGFRFHRRVLGRSLAMKYIPFRLSLILVPYLFVGCRGYDPADVTAQTFPVKGRIVLANGSPLRGGKIILHPKDVNLPEAEGIVGSDGKFTLTTYKKNDGAVPGPHVVTVDRTFYDKRGNPKEDKSLPIPSTFWKTETSKLEVEIRPEENVLELRLN
jgi:hypothetical protein